MLLFDKRSTNEPRRVWVQNVAVSASLLQARLNTIRARASKPDPAREALATGVEDLADKALKAANRTSPIPSRWAIWWRGTLIEASYQNLHAAESLIAVLYSDAEVESELPEAIARVDAGLSTSDPRRAAAHRVPRLPPGDAKRDALRKLIEIGYAAADREHSRLRSFRNTIVVSTALISVFVIIFCAVVAANPSWVPLCFENTAAGDSYCPTDGSNGVPVGSDVIVVGLLGLLGGTLSAAVSIRGLMGTSTPYDVPAALAMLKVPFGAMTAIGALVAIRGDFVPGLSELDSQVQILAYALVFGYAQQLLTGLIDRHAQQILGKVPGKSTDHPPPPAVYDSVTTTETAS